MKNKSKSTRDCLQLLLNNFHYLQHSLNANLHNNNFLYNKLIVAYQDITTCQIAYSNPPTTLTSLINSLQSLIVTYKKINGTIGQPANAFLQPTEQPTEQPTDIFFTDRRYYRPKSQPSPLNNRYGNNTRTCFIYKRGNY